ncbi:MAG: flavin reductase family protein [Acidobacteriota bacterium]
MPITNDEFRSALSRFASGVTVITTRDADGTLHGITVSAFSSVSLDPPLVLVCIERSAGSHHVFQETGLFVVNILSSDQLELSERFASPSSDRFAGVGMTLNIDGIPLLSNCLANLECRLKLTADGGDHSIFIGEVENASIHEGDPLIYFRSDYRTIE